MKTQVLARLREQVEAKAGATFIGAFDHYAHVRRQPDGKIADDIEDSRHLLFCLSNAIPNPLVPAVRPRSISVVEPEKARAAFATFLPMLRTVTPVLVLVLALMILSE
jgi:hypothetical protein